MSPQDLVVAFYAHMMPDARGRWLREMWAWDDLTLEADHQYIQWMFPNDVPSGVNPDAPLVTAVSVAAFQTDAALRADLERSLDRMLAFYGFERRSEAIVSSNRFAERRRVWLTPGNHNHLRLTRILVCLRLLSLPALGVALFEALAAVHAGHPGAVTRTTYAYWKRAADDCRAAAG